MMFLIMIFFFFFFFDFFFFFSFCVFFMFCIFFFYGGFFDGLFFSDFLNLVLMFVSFWVFALSFFSLGLSVFSMFLFWLIFFFIIISFYSVSFFLFYISFEFVFVILFFYLLSLGKSFERIQASFYMFFYTLFFSFPLLFFIVDLFCFYSDFFVFVNYYNYCSFFWVFMFLVFMVKLPVFSFHSWLIKAHVEAPVSGSMVLAGVMLKLGGYGIIRFFFLLKNLYFSLYFIFSFFFYVSLIGSLVISMVCFRQMDLKMIIAYSSVVHMGLMFLGLFSFLQLGVLGSVLLMVAHGFVSPLMFFLMNSSYVLFNSRSLMLLKGALIVSSVFCVFWFIVCVLNLGLPPFMSFYSEVLVIGSMGFLSLFEWTMLFFFCFFTGVYCMFSYVALSHGSPTYFQYMHLSCSDFIVVFVFIYFVIFYPFVFFSFF